MRSRQRVDSNCRPQSVTTVEGTPKRETHPMRNAWATASAMILWRGIASGHLVNQLTHVKRYVNPCDSGRGPTRSM